LIVLNPILKELEQSASKNIKMGSHLILGQHGVGKTAILKLLLEAFNKSSRLKSTFNLISVPSFFHGGDIVAKSEQMIYDIGVSDLKKHQLLIIDDIDLALTGSEKESHDLREILIRDEPKVSLIATASNAFPEELGHNKALFGFLSQHKLESASDNDVKNLLQKIIETPKWHKLNEELVQANPFWVTVIAGNNPRLLTLLNSAFHLHEKFLNTEDFLIAYFEMAAPIFKCELMQLPQQGRYFLEEASTCEQFFKIKNLNLQIKNPAREATRLVQIGHLAKTSDGEYSFINKPLKAWLRYIKQCPFGRVLNVDIENLKG
ncbi:MAG: ATP-binding protein, partial [Oligoflexia bacterium]|nr:ATP-binding protein [Oligoflexia bacterium]